MTGFKDHFSGHASAYARYRPTYPPALYEFLARKAPDTIRAWDCATGNGQVAVGLSAWFKRVLATDASKQQIDAAEPRDNIEYRVAGADASGLPAHSVSLVTVGQALHWFDLDAFYTEVRRVLKPRGLIGVWSYALVYVDPGVDRVLKYLIDDLTGPWWPPERQHVDNGYVNLPFPFAPIEAPSFDMRLDWDFSQFANYLRTWSGVQRYLKDTGRDPVGEVEADLRAAWGDPNVVRKVSWPLMVKVGKV